VKPTCARQADRQAHLAAGWTRQELAERNQIGVGTLIEPPAPSDEFFTEVAEMRDRAAERCQPQPKKDEQNLACACGPTLRVCSLSVRIHYLFPSIPGPQFARPHAAQARAIPQPR
jgi:hypothetical protein